MPDRSAAEFRHGDHYWQWGLYNLYPQEFPNGVNFVVGKSDWTKDWNYVQPPSEEPRRQVRRNHLAGDLRYAPACPRGQLRFAWASAERAAIRSTLSSTAILSARSTCPTPE